jgi:hypothetical protein
MSASDRHALSRPALLDDAERLQLLQILAHQLERHGPVLRRQ